MESLFKLFHLENIHPILVHFPIALSILYAVLELIPFRKLRDNLFTTKAILVILGTISIFASKQAGEVAALAYQDPAILKIINLHELFAKLSLIIFSLIFIFYLVQLSQKVKPKLFKSKTGKLCHLISSNPFILITLAVLGLISVSLTGAFGGMIVWGPQNDPFTTFTYFLFFK